MLVRSLLVFFLSIVFLSTFGCQTTGVNTVTAEDFRGSRGEGSVYWESDLASGDMLEISVEVDGQMEVSRHRADVNPLGYVTLPLVGDVHVSGLRLETARKLIHNRYAKYYVNPPVTMVSVVSTPDGTEWGYVTVMGRVENPGRIPIESADGVSLTSAIQAAGGLASSAKTSSIRVTRLDSSGKKVQVYINFDEIGKSGNAEADLNLLDGDIVFVPERIF